MSLLCITFVSRAIEQVIFEKFMFTQSIQHLWKTCSGKKNIFQDLIIYAIRIIYSFHKIHYIKLGHALYKYII